MGYGYVCKAHVKYFVRAELAGRVLQVSMARNFSESPKIVTPKSNFSAPVLKKTPGCDPFRGGGSFHDVSQGSDPPALGVSQGNNVVARAKCANFDEKSPKSLGRKVGPVHGHNRPTPPRRRLSLTCYRPTRSIPSTRVTICYRFGPRGLKFDFRSIAGGRYG